MKTVFIALVTNFSLGIGVAEAFDYSCENLRAQNSKIFSPDSTCIGWKNLAKIDDDQDKNNYVILINKSEQIELSPEMKKNLSKIDFNLFIHGVCAQDCSRLLIPLATKIYFTPDSFAMLDNSTVVSNLRFMAKKLNLTPTETISISNEKFFTAQADYEAYLNNHYLTDFNLLAKTQTNVTHLTWHSFALQQLKRGENSKCWSKKKFGVILTPNYFWENSARVNKHYSLPNKSSIIKSVNEAFGTKHTLIYSYESLPFYGC